MLQLRSRLLDRMCLMVERVHLKVHLRFLFLEHRLKQQLILLSNLYHHVQIIRILFLMCYASVYRYLTNQVLHKLQAQLQKVHIGIVQTLRWKL